MKKLGLILIAIALLLPLIWFVPLAGKHDPIAVMSQYLGVAALVCMGIVQLFQPLPMTVIGAQRVPSRHPIRLLQGMCNQRRSARHTSNPAPCKVAT